MDYHEINGRSFLPPSGPGEIIVRLAETQGRHSAQIDHLIIRVSRLEERRPPFPWRDLWPLAVAAMGFGLVLAGKMSVGDAIALLGRG
jgi:hypothetical protein